MAFSLKGLMSEIRPRDIAIGAFGSIQQRFKEDRELDQARLNNTIASSEGLLEDANTEVQRINKRTELYNQTAEIYGPSVADYLAQTKTFALYDGTANVNALKDIDSKARNAQRVIAEGGFETSTNPYLEDTRTKLLDNLNNIESELQALNNIPDKTGKVALRIKDLNRVKESLAQETVPNTGTKVTPFPTGMSDAQQTRELAAYLSTAINLGVDYMDEKAMAEIGFPAVTLQQADSVLNIGADINKLATTFGQDFTLQLLQSDNPAEVIASYQNIYDDLLRKSLPTNKTEEDKEDVIDLTPKS
tara:strand:+ start:984 stop:1895 length:912 start_codon:yes stop_codon:yes gene_type:complete